jgi:DNA-binding NarL/FixJ family response regulator
VGLSRVRIAVCEEHEIFRAGISASLRDDPSIEVVYEGRSGPVPVRVDAIVASPRAAIRERFDAPVVISSRELIDGAAPRSGNRVMAMLPRADLSASQLVATVRAAAAGLEVTPENGEHLPGGALDPRSLLILRLLADGADTREISESLAFSPRTIKACIYDIERKLGARNRTHAVAEGFRNGLI